MSYLIGVFMFILGTIIASFLGVVIFRVPNNMSIIKPNSFCPNCNKPIKWYDNIPLISYICLKGKCRYCKSKIGISSFLLELMGGILYLLAYLSFGLSYDLLFIIPIISLLIVIAEIDYYHQVIYDWSWISLLIIVAFYVLYLGLTKWMVPIDNFIGAGIGFISFLLIKVIGKIASNQEVLGMGDVILMGIAGLLLDYKIWLFSLLAGSLLGSIIEITLIICKKRKRGETVAFGPYLVSGMIVGILYGSQIVDWFLKLVK